MLVNVLIYCQCVFLFIAIKLYKSNKVPFKLKFSTFIFFYFLYFSKNIFILLLYFSLLAKHQLTRFPENIYSQLVKYVMLTRIKSFLNILYSKQ